MDSEEQYSNAFVVDRISNLSDEILCHILSFLSTFDAVKTSVLSHRWKNVWASVPTVDLCDLYPKEFEPDRFAGFVDHVLSLHGSSSIHRFCLSCTKEADFARVYDWIRIAISHNVVELDLDLYEFPEVVTRPFKFPRSLYMCKTLVSLKLSLNTIIAMTHSPNCFPSLKFLHVNVVHPYAMDGLFSCCSVLEDLIIRAEPELEDDPENTVNISAPKLKTLEMSFFDDVYGEHYKETVFINVDAPNLEKFSYDGNMLVIYSSKDEKSLRNARINFSDHARGTFRFSLADADLVHRLFTVIVNVKYLALSGPIFGDPKFVHRYCVPMFNNLTHLVLYQQACCSWQSFKNFLNASPNLEYLWFQKDIKCFDQAIRHQKHDLVHEWSAPESVPICLSSSLKNVCIRGFQGRPDQMKVVEYLLKHSEVLNNMVLYTGSNYLDEEMKLWKEVSTMQSRQPFRSSLVSNLWDKVSAFPRVSKTCQIIFPKVHPSGFEGM